MSKIIKLFRIPDPWDYHENGAYIVMAETKEKAIEIVKAKEAEKKYPGSSIKYDKIEEIEDGVYTDCGCDD